MSSLVSATDLPNIQAALRRKDLGTKVYNMLDAAEDQGVPASAELVMSAQPVTTDTIDIGADVYEFVTAAGAVADDANIAVEIGASAAATLTNLVAAINATYSPDQHPNITNVATTAPALANGTEAVVASEDGTSLVAMNADAAGGTILPGDQSIVLAEAITDAADIWTAGNVDMNTLQGNAQIDRKVALAAVTITAAMITNDLRIDFDFTPTRFLVQVQDSSGVSRGAGDDAYTISGNAIKVVFGGGADPDIQATDVLHVQAYE